MKLRWKIASLGFGWVAFRYVRVAKQKRRWDESRTEFAARMVDPYIGHLQDEDYDTATGSVPDRRES